ncbi:MAG: class II aldolase/adducin family protein [Bacteroidota bacterium]|nr:class II aldolase/adducin family protein [Bacteroidota bacterium]
MINSEGYIKFNTNWQKHKIDISTKNFNAINNWRHKLYKLNLIGALENGIGFGNISMREQNLSSFIITGSASGNIAKLKKEHYARVTKTNISCNTVDCEGLIKASSESLSHSVFYEYNKKINSVIHIHNYELWKYFLYKFPTTSVNAEFGTAELAKELQSIILKSDKLSGIIILEGHKDGIISFGDTLDTAGHKILELQRLFNSNT